VVDGLGDRMKEQYEDRTRFLLPRRTYTIIRVDGKAFHSYTRKFKRPFDDGLSNAMDRTCVELCKNIQGAQLGYVQSDEISIVVTDFESTQTAAWFNGNLQKIVSVASSMATAYFNIFVQDCDRQNIPDGPATFDARAFTIPDREEVCNYLIWRQKDASRNSVQAVAQSLYSHAQLHGKNNANLQDLIFRMGQNWDDYSPRNKRGAAIARNYNVAGCETPGRSEWQADQNTPIFTQDRGYLDDRIPYHGYEKKQLVTLPTMSGPTAC
jgi:tRNA(His) guanylyltransferase